MTAGLLCSVLFAGAQQMTIATYNLRYDNRGDSAKGNGWAQRGPVISGLIRFHDFDVFGTQEGLHHQLEDLKQQLPGYDYIGVGRDDGKEKGEHSAIFYKKDKFKLLNKGDFWLSAITDKPNKGWDAVLPRICSWGEFKEIKTGFTFYFFNLHMDHVGVQARSESAKLVLQKIREMAGKKAVILTGDFNVDQTSPSYAVLHHSDVLEDAYEAADFRYALNGTFNAFNANGKTDSRIDHIFLNDKLHVQRYGVLTDTYRGAVADAEQVNTSNFPKEVSMKQYVAREPSDHFPVMAVVTYGKK